MQHFMYPSSSQIIKKHSGNVFCESMFQLVSGKKKLLLSFQSQRQKGPSRLSSVKGKANFCGMGVHQCKRHECEGTTGVDAYIKFVQRHIEPSR